MGGAQIRRGRVSKPGSFSVYQVAKPTASFYNNSHCYYFLAIQIANSCYDATCHM